MVQPSRLGSMGVSLPEDSSADIAAGDSTADAVAVAPIAVGTIRAIAVAPIPAVAGDAAVAVANILGFGRHAVRPMKRRSRQDGGLPTWDAATDIS